jgi:hypothetical protein
MKRAIVLLLLIAGTAHAHIGSPDVFFEGDAGPYKLFVTVRAPKVIPGVAEIEIRSESPDVQELRVVPMRLTGPGSELPPTPDRATRSPADPQLFTRASGSWSAARCRCASRRRVRTDPACWRCPCRLSHRRRWRCRTRSARSCSC